jgi:hypothetical protein
MKILSVGIKKRLQQLCDEAALEFLNFFFSLLSPHSFAFHHPLPLFFFLFIRFQPLIFRFNVAGHVTTAALKWKSFRVNWWAQFSPKNYIQEQRSSSNRLQATDRSN